MDEHQDRPEDQPDVARHAGEGVRIIGDDEASEALETGHAAGRRPDEEPRFGDAPAPPPPGDVQVRFPRPEWGDPAKLPRPPGAGAGRGPGAHAAPGPAGGGPGGADPRGDREAADVVEGSGAGEEGAAGAPRPEASPGDPAGRGGEA